MPSSELPTGVVFTHDSTCLQMTRRDYILDIAISRQVIQLTDETITDKKLSRRQFMGTAAAGAVVLGAVAGANEVRAASNSGR